MGRADPTSNIEHRTSSILHRAHGGRGYNEAARTPRDEPITSETIMSDRKYRHSGYQDDDRDREQQQRQEQKKRPPGDGVRRYDSAPRGRGLGAPDHRRIQMLPLRPTSLRRIHRQIRAPAPPAARPSTPAPTAPSSTPARVSNAGSPSMPASRAKPRPMTAGSSNPRPCATSRRRNRRRNPTTPDPHSTRSSRNNSRAGRGNYGFITRPLSFSTVTPSNCSL